MASRTMEMADAMHYETRQIREALAASTARLKSARFGRLAPDLAPQQGASMLQEWEGLSSMGDIEHPDIPAANNPLYNQMRSALLAFEQEVGYAAPARERAFFSALRTQLMEAAALREADQRDMAIAAAYKWFSRHKPQGPEADPIAAAVLASSLSVEAAPPEARLSTQGAVGTAQRLASAHSANPGQSLSGALGPPPGPQGKHQFFSVFSRAAPGGGIGTAAGGAAMARATGLRAPSPNSALRPSSSREGGAGGGGAGSLSLNHPLVMHPSVANGGAPAAGVGRGMPPSASAAAASLAGTSRSRFTSTDLYAPGKLVRPQELDELDHRAAAAAAAAATASGSGAGGPGAAGGLHAKPWMSGPFRAPVGTGGPAGRGAAGKAGPEEDEEVRALREKWSAMDAKTHKSVADVQSKVAEWTLQRARLEEEIVRRQEVHRFAPAGGGPAQPWQQPGTGRRDGEDPLAPGTLSPYANANADLAAATAAAASAAANPSGVTFTLPGAAGAAGGLGGAAGANMRLRHADVSAYDVGRADLVARLASLGVSVNSDTLDRALRPVEDRPFLDCISRLPKPGEHLVSRPGSVRLPAAKKKRSKSAGKKRPKSGK
ncbi:hypothetical protein HYH03_004477 [Edaphochlamys debaryana]|uniref:Uncharacterized protein n=1 Tax=Edaphochlamys debaryana TaxID=47281 RepID=A0A835Y9Q8_9CHLO|nr:hypothetical protein HYH03_004477 [Edaphochlamys debaryana]|eukprot:KAG2497744.1 hypothetical protein HYH03_004477 [Edaphochlamys debaryana]